MDIAHVRRLINPLMSLYKVDFTHIGDDGNFGILDCIEISNMDIISGISVWGSDVLEILIVNKATCDILFNTLLGPSDAEEKKVAICALVDALLFFNRNRKIDMKSLSKKFFYGLEGSHDGGIASKRPLF